MAIEFYLTLIIVYAMFVIIEFAYQISKYNITILETFNEKAIFGICFTFLVLLSPIVVLIQIGEVLCLMNEINENEED